MPAPGVNVIQDRRGKLLTLFERGRTLVLSACSDREEFISKRPRVRRFAARMATGLRQQAVFVPAFPSDSFLVELTEHPRSRREPDRGGA